MWETETALLDEINFGPPTELNIALIRLQLAGREWTAHNIECEKFAMALLVAGAEDLLDTVCYDGSEAKRMADEHDRATAANS